MRIAILGWGSLIRDPRELHLKEGRFTLGGPELPLEFSRRSADGRLTLVIDEDNGMPPCATYYAISGFEVLRDAICDLQHREGTSGEKIGSLCLNGERQKLPTSKVASESISNWLSENGEAVDAVIWTNLGPTQSFSFSERAAEKYLKSLTGLCRDKALDYLKNAPREVRTPLREKMIQWLSKP